MQNIDRALLESVVRIKLSPEFAPFVKYLKDLEMKHLTACGSLNEDRPTHVAQGSYRAVKDVNDLIEQSTKLLDKERRQ